MAAILSRPQCVKAYYESVTKGLENTHYTIWLNDKEATAPEFHIVIQPYGPTFRDIMY